MGDPSEDDVPTMTSGADLRRRSSPGAEAASEPDADDESAADADDRTIQQAPDADADADPTTAIEKPPVTPVRPRAPSAPVVPPPVPPRAPSAPKVTADLEPPTSPKTPLATEDDPEDSITATAPRVDVAKLPLQPPKSVEIRTLEDDIDDAGEETEVKTIAGNLPTAPRAPEPPLPSIATEADAADDSVTQMAPIAARIGSSPDIPTATGVGAESAGVIRISAKSLMPSTGGPAPKAVGDGPYDDESVTARGPAVGSAYEDESITTQAPATLGLPPPIDGETEGTTKKVRKRSPSTAGEASAADQEAESITTQAPGHLTNMLRVIASEKNARDDDDDDPIQAHTQVMANAPLKPSDLGAHSVRGGAALAQQLEPTSESGLRVAQPERSDGDRASLGVIGAPPRERRISNMAVIGGSDGGRDKATRPPTPYIPSPELDTEKKPPYALLVGVVAVISIAIPALLFVVLNQGGGELVPRVAAQPSPDPVTRGDVPRARAGKPGASTSASGAKKPPRR